MGQAIIGINPTQINLVAAVADFGVGDVGGFDDPTDGYKEFIYGMATAAITAAGYVCVEGILNGNFSMITTANTAAGTLGGHGSRVGIAQAAIPINNFGWFQIYGRGSMRSAASNAIGTRQNTTATAGVLDDDGTAASRAINGIVLKTVVGGAEATAPDVRFSYPTVGATI